MNELLVLLLPLAAFSGWWIARSDKKTNNLQKEDEYFKGLSYLLEDETDKAIDIFFRIAHLDDSTVENQITLGNLFRHRGELDRALHIHTNLLEHGSLSPDTEQNLNLAIAEDYLAAGIMNHAEDYFQKVRNADYLDMRELAMTKLISIYAERKRWENALEVVKELDPFSRSPIQQQAAHFYCEQAKQALDNDDDCAAEELLQKALQCDRKCTRATIKLGRLAQSQKKFVSAIGHFNEVEKQNPAFIPEILPDLEACYNALNQLHEWKSLLSRLVSTYHNPVLTLRLNQLIEQTKGKDSACDFLHTTLANNPNILTIQAYLNAHRDEDNKVINLASDSVDKILAFALKYRCQDCGFRGNQLNWQCPGCKKWGTSVPVSDITLKESVS